MTSPNGSTLFGTMGGLKASCFIGPVSDFEQGIFTVTGGTKDYLGAAGAGTYTGTRQCTIGDCSVNGPNHVFTLTFQSGRVLIPPPSGTALAAASTGIPASGTP